MLKQGLARTIYQSERSIARVLLAHGAGAGNQHPFMHQFSQALLAHDIEVISFNFPYMQTAYEQEVKRPPNGNKQLVAHFAQELADMRMDLPIFLAGKSMGGRIATQLIAASLPEQVKGGLVLGYPFIPPGKPEKLAQRTEHFPDLTRPVAILQGERDTFGGTELLKSIQLPAQVEVTWIKSGDHSFKPLKSSGLTEQDNILFAADHAAQFIKRQLELN